MTLSREDQDRLTDTFHRMEGHAARRNAGTFAMWIDQVVIQSGLPPTVETRAFVYALAEQPDES